MKGEQPTPHPLFNQVFKKQLYKDLIKVKEVIQKKPKYFKMDRWGSSHICDTAHCIGGWLDVFMYNRRSKELQDASDYYSRINQDDVAYLLFNEIFYPRSANERGKVGWEHITDDPYNATVEEGCEAINLFITNTLLFLDPKDR